MDRKLASIRKIAEIKPIVGADAIEVARVNGWMVVVKKGEFKEGDLACYIEIDSWVPHTLAPFLTKGKEPREFGGVKGERLRTIKLRGQVSQGLLLPVEFHVCGGMHFLGMSGMDDDLIYSTHQMPREAIPDDYFGFDLSDWLGIQKWERPIPAQLQGQMRGNFPSFIRKTDQERIQNLPKVFDDMASQYEVSVKLDGSSMTVYWYEGEMGVCSRNVELKLDQEGNTFVDTAKRIFGGKEFAGLAIQGELMGPGIQGNRESLKQHEFFVFDIYDIEDQSYLTPKYVRAFCEEYGLLHVPVKYDDVSLEDLGVTCISEMLEYAEGPSLSHPVREGLVFKRVDGAFSFKAISNQFLLKEKD